MMRVVRQALACGFALALSTSAMSAGTVHHVTIEGMQFEPGKVEAAAGDTIIWTNHDLVPHTVSAGSAIESGLIETNKTWAFKVTSKGTVEYVCRFHPAMRGTLVVR
jgi:plastocyanin